MQSPQVKLKKDASGSLLDVVRLINNYQPYLRQTIRHDSHDEVGFFGCEDQNVGGVGV